MNESLQTVAALVGELARLRREAERAGETDVDTGVLATVTADGRPTARTINVHFAPDHQIVFFVNRGSEKGVALQGNAAVALCLFWKASRVQVTLDAQARELGAQAADQIWASRDRNTQLLALVAARYPGADAQTLKREFESARRSLSFERVPRPESWTAYVLDLERVSVWRANWPQSGQRRLFQVDGDQVSAMEAPPY